MKSCHMCSFWFSQCVTQELIWSSRCVQQSSVSFCWLWSLWAAHTWTTRRRTSSLRSHFTRLERFLLSARMPFSAVPTHSRTPSTAFHSVTHKRNEESAELYARSMTALSLARRAAAATGSWPMRWTSCLARVAWLALTNSRELPLSDSRDEYSWGWQDYTSAHMWQDFIFYPTLSSLYLHRLLSEHLSSIYLDNMIVNMQSHPPFCSKTVSRPIMNI